MAVKGSDLASSEFVRKHIEASVRAASESWIDNQMSRAYFEIAGESAHGETLQFDSVLEAAYWSWWRALDSVAGLGFGLSLQRKVKVGRYFLDFAVVQGPHRCLGPDELKYVNDNWSGIAIELDGHAFHEKTLEQVTYRNQRDRELQAAGWKVFHYSFSEFEADPESCVRGPAYAAMSQMMALSRDFYQGRKS